MRKRKPQLVFALTLLSVFVWIKLSVTEARSASDQPNPQARAQILLGKRLFEDDRFSTPKGDLHASCSTCHLFNQDPQGLRAFTDFFNRSWFSHRTEDPRRLHPRNSPTLFDVALHPQLHFDGEFASLEALVKGTFAGRPMGWLKGEETNAYAHLRTVLLNDSAINKPGSYQRQFKAAYSIEIARLTAEETANHVATAVATFVRTLRSPMNSPYDQFVTANDLSDLVSQPAYESLLVRLEQKASLKFTSGFDEEALRGMKIFFRTSGDSSVGNCVACHVSPLFTDFSFHNIGVSQAEYDGLHGAGRFAEMAIPAATSTRPIERLRMAPERGLPERADLGHWSLIDLKRSSLRRPGETEEALLQRMIGTIKTPGLRHLAYSYPYLHNGAFADLGDTLREKIRLSELARAGKLRSADEQLFPMRLRAEDVAPLIRFLNTLNEELRLSY